MCVENNNVSIIGPDAQNNPGQDGHSPDRVNWPQDVIFPEPRPQIGRHRAEHECWVLLAARVLGSWPMTLRLALIVVLAAGALVIVLAL
jgi:hypothetical protein